MSNEVCRGGQSCLLFPQGSGAAPSPSPRSLNYWATVQKKMVDGKPDSTESHTRAGVSGTADGVRAVALFLSGTLSHQSRGA